MELFIAGKGAVRLDQSDFVGQGGEGKVYARGGTAYKIYADPTRMIPTAKIKELAVLTHGDIVRPDEVLLDNCNRPVGYTMRRLQDVVPLCRLFTRAFRERRGVTADQILALVRRFQETVQHVHDQGVLVVDMNEMNFLVDRSLQRVLFIDVDSYMTRSFPATAIMDSIRDRHRSGYSIETDWFSFAILTFQMFIGVHPYRGKHPSLLDLDARMLANISVFDPCVSVPPTSYPLDTLPPAYRDWYVDTFEHGGRTPPPRGAGHAAPLVVKLQLLPAKGPLQVREIARFWTSAAPLRSGPSPAAGCATPPIAASPTWPVTAAASAAPPVAAGSAGQVTGVPSAPPAIAAGSGGQAIGTNAAGPTSAANSAGLATARSGGPATILQVLDGSTVLTSDGVCVRGAIRLPWSKLALRSSAAEWSAALLVTPRFRRLVLAVVDRGDLRLWNVAEGAEIACAVRADALTLCEERLAVKQAASLYEVQWLELPASLQPMLRPAANVLPHATQLFDGVAVQDIVGACYITICPRPGECRTIRLKEMDGRRVLDARYSNSVLMAASEKDGEYAASIFRFRSGTDEYDVRTITDRAAPDIEFVVLDSGICLWLNPAQELEVFSSRMGAASVRVIDELALHGARLFKDGPTALFARDGCLFEMRT